MKSPDGGSYLEESQVLIDNSPTTLIAQVPRDGRQLSPIEERFEECTGQNKDTCRRGSRANVVVRRTSITAFSVVYIFFKK